jgi:hypothetical protein
MVRRLILLSTAALLLSCAHLSVEKPAGFAEVETENRYRAVSPEGMVYRVRTVDNYPVQSLSFWSDALKNHLIKEGYTLLGEGESFQAGDYEGEFFEWAVPYGHESYIYLTAILVSEETIAIAEAAAEHTVYSEHREAVKKSLKSIVFE